jgi:hypothetical protein
VETSNAAAAPPFASRTTSLGTGPSKKRDIASQSVSVASAMVGRFVENAVLDDMRRRPAPVMPSDETIASPLSADGPSCSCVLVHVKQMSANHAELLQRVVVDGVPSLASPPSWVRLRRARVALVERLRSHGGTTTLRG